MSSLASPFHLDPALAGALNNKVTYKMPSADVSSMPTGEHMTSAQMLTLTVLERMGGCISLVAVFSIFVAFGLIRELRNVQNTFIVFASVSNVGASVASVIAMDGLLSGKRSSLCQTQAFMFEMFMQSDPWWSLAMAINVFLVFFFRASPDSFRKWWWLYCLICYGGPLIIALALLLVKHPHRGPVYGEATIWCWVDRSWDDIRIYTYYMLIWICIVGSLVLYFLVGYQVFHTRNQLRSFSTSRSRDATQNDDVSPSLYLNKISLGSMRLLTPQGKKGQKVRLPNLPLEGFYGTVITEVQIIRSTASCSTLPTEPKRVHLAPPVSMASAFDHDCELQNNTASQFYSTVTSPPKLDTKKNQPDISIFGRVSQCFRRFVNNFVVEDRVKRAYLRTSFLFALSVLVTWIPSSMNRIHSWMTGESPYEYHVATASVLPLQGLWNAVIFFVTSSAALKRYWMGLRYQRRHGLNGVAAAARGGCTDAIMLDNEEGGNVPAQRSTMRDDRGESTDADAMTLGSDIELHRTPARSGKSSASL